MVVGIPKGLLYYKYAPFFNTFFEELGAEVITSVDTNKLILNEGVRYSVDEACLPIKVFHGHVASIKDKCDLMVIPRVISIREREFICPKFCGLPEMIKNDIPHMPVTTDIPIYFYDKNKLYKWARDVGSKISKNRFKIGHAFKAALKAQNASKVGINDTGFELKVALLGHPYNVYDSFINMNVHKKLNELGIGVITEENVDDEDIDIELKELFKKPFWSFARNSYGSILHLFKNNMIEGMVYISSFGCGIDSVIIELIKDKVKDFPILVLKIDEQTGEAGFDTRVEAFSDMLKRRAQFESNISTPRKHLYWGKDFI